jgi:hypothetical protein
MASSAATDAAGGPTMNAAADNWVGAVGAATEAELLHAVATTFRLAGEGGGASAVLPSHRPHHHPVVPLDIADPRYGNGGNSGASLPTSPNASGHGVCGVCRRDGRPPTHQCIMDECGYVECAECHGHTALVSSRIPRAQHLLQSLASALARAVALTRELGPVLAAPDGGPAASASTVNPVHAEGAHGKTAAAADPHDGGAASVRHRELRHAGTQTNTGLMARPRGYAPRTAASLAASGPLPPSGTGNTTSDDDCAMAASTVDDCSGAASTVAAKRPSGGTGSHRKKRAKSIEVVDDSAADPAAPAASAKATTYDQPRRQRSQNTLEKSFASLAQRFSKSVELPPPMTSSADAAFMAEVNAQAEQYTAGICTPNSALPPEKLKEKDLAALIQLSCDELFCSAVFDTSSALAEHRAGHVMERRGVRAPLALACSAT